MQTTREKKEETQQQKLQTEHQRLLEVIAPCFVRPLILAGKLSTPAQYIFSEEKIKHLEALAQNPSVLCYLKQRDVGKKYWQKLPSSHPNLSYWPSRDAQAEKHLFYTLDILALLNAAGICTPERIDFLFLNRNYHFYAACQRLQEHGLLNETNYAILLKGINQKFVDALADGLILLKKGETYPADYQLALKVAIKTDNTEFLHAVHKLADLNKIVIKRAQHDPMTLLEYAVSKRKVPAATWLLEHNVKPTTESICIAIKRSLGCVELYGFMRKLLQKVDVNAADRHGRTPLLTAVKRLFPLAPMQILLEQKSLVIDGERLLKLKDKKEFCAAIIILHKAGLLTQENLKLLFGRDEWHCYPEYSCTAKWIVALEQGVVSGDMNFREEFRQLLLNEVTDKFIIQVYEKFKKEINSVSKEDGCLLAAAVESGCSNEINNLLMAEVPKELFKTYYGSTLLNKSLCNLEFATTLLQSGARLSDEDLEDMLSARYVSDKPYTTGAVIVLKEFSPDDVVWLEAQTEKFECWPKFCRGWETLSVKTRFYCHVLALRNELFNTENELTPRRPTFFSGASKKKEQYELLSLLHDIEKRFCSVSLQLPKLPKVEEEKFALITHQPAHLSS